MGLWWEGAPYHSVCICTHTYIHMCMYPSLSLSLSLSLYVSFPLSSYDKDGC